MYLILLYGHSTLHQLFKFHRFLDSHVVRNEFLVEGLFKSGLCIIFTNLIVGGLYSPPPSLLHIVEHIGRKPHLLFAGALEDLEDLLDLNHPLVSMSVV